jgi:predicted RNase H-like nuclease (RuvC/YqgF family)
MNEAELIQKLRKENEELKKKIDDMIPGTGKLNDTLDAFTKQTAPGIESMYKTVGQLEKAAKDLEPFLKHLQGMDKEALKNLMKKK